MLIKFAVSDFDFEKIFRSGLFYFFYTEKPERRILLGNKSVNLEFYQKRSFLYVSSIAAIPDAERREIKKRINYCLGIEEDLSKFYSVCKNDWILKNFLPRIKKTRIISSYTDFEALAGAVVSQNNSYANYRKQMRRIYEKTDFRPEKCAANADRFKVGYKAAYLKELSVNYGKMPIKNIKGIGAYSLNLFEIFQRRNYGAFYVD